jgi:hypothetical protein
MTPWLTPHGHVHDRLPGHVHAADAHEDEHVFWLGAGEAYARLRASLQLLAGLQLLGVRREDQADLRRAVLVKVRILLDEVDERLSTISAPDGALPHLDGLSACREALGEIARRQGAELARGTGGPSAQQTHQMLRQTTDWLRRCQRYDLGLRFYGSGGCADAEHALSHLRSQEAPHD